MMVHIIILTFIVVTAFVLVIAYIRHLQYRRMIGLDDTRGASHEVILGTLDVSSGCLVIGDRAWPLAGDTIRGVPNGSHEIRGALLIHPNGMQCIANFRVDFGSVQRAADVSETVDLAIDTGQVIIADPRGPQDIIMNTDFPDVKEIAYRRFEEATAERGDLYGALRDSSGRTWAIIVSSGIGDGPYEVKVERVGILVSRLSCDFVETD